MTSCACILSVCKWLTFCRRAPARPVLTVAPNCPDRATPVRTLAYWGDRSTGFTRYPTRPQIYTVCITQIYTVHSMYHQSKAKRVLISIIQTRQVCMLQANRFFSGWHSKTFHFIFFIIYILALIFARYIQNVHPRRISLRLISIDLNSEWGFPNLLCPDPPILLPGPTRHWRWCSLERIPVPSRWSPPAQTLQKQRTCVTSVLHVWGMEFTLKNKIKLWLLLRLI